MKRKSMGSFAVQVTCTMALLSGMAMANNLLVQDGFEDGYNLGTAVWTAGAGCNAEVVSTGAAEGVNALSVTEGAAVANISLAVPGAEPLAYFRLLTKLTPSQSDTVTETTSLNGANAAFYVNASGDVRACTNGSWVTIGNISGVNASTWYAFIVHLDYSAQKFNVYRGNDGANSTVWTVLNSAPLPFSDTTTTDGFDTFEVTGDVTLDGVIGLKASLESADAYAASPLAFEAVAVDPAVAIVQHVPDHTFAPAEATLFGPLGKLLTEGRDDGDKIRISTSSGLDTFTMTDGAWDTDAGPLAPGTAYWLIPSNSGTSYGVFPASYSPTQLATETFSPGDAGIVTLYGPTASGWTAINWTTGTTRTLASAGLNATDLTGDMDGMRCYSIPTGGKAFYASRWNGSEWTFLFSNNPTGDRLEPGDTVWVYQKNPTDINWTVK